MKSETCCNGSKIKLPGLVKWHKTRRLRKLAKCTASLKWQEILPTAKICQALGHPVVTQKTLIAKIHWRWASVLKNLTFYYHSFLLRNLYPNCLIYFKVFQSLRIIKNQSIWNFCFSHLMKKWKYLSRLIFQKSNWTISILIFG